MKVSKEFRIGLIVVMAISLTILGVNYLKGINLFQNQRTFTAYYSNSAGLTEASPIILNGFKVGLVQSVEMDYNANQQIKVTMLINDDALQIPLNSRAMIYSKDLLSSKAIQLLLTDTTVFHSSGDTLIGEVEQEIQEAIQQELAPLKLKIDELLVNVDGIITNLNDVFDTEATKKLPEAFEAMSAALKNLEKTTIRLDDLVKEEKVVIHDIFAHVNSITGNLENNNEQLSNVIQNFSSISDSLAKINLVETFDNAGKAIASLNSIMTKVNNGEGTIGELLHNDTLYNNLESASHELDLLLEDLQLNPKKYINVSVFGKKQKTVSMSTKDKEEIIEELKKN